MSGLDFFINQVPFSAILCAEEKYIYIYISKEKTEKNKSTFDRYYRWLQHPLKHRWQYCKKF